MEINFLRLAEVIKSQPEVRTEANLGRLLGVSPSLLAEWRAGHVNNKERKAATRDIGLRAKVRMLDYGGERYLSLKDNLYSFLTKSQIEKIEKKNRELALEWERSEKQLPLPWPTVDELLSTEKREPINWDDVKSPLKEINM